MPIMHEFSIAESLVEQIVDITAENNLPAIDRVELEVGELRQVVPDILQLAFRETARGTPAEGAALMIEEVSARAQCRRCTRFFRPAPLDYSCPACGVADVQVLAGNALILKSVEANEPTGLVIP
jgi:hydrogenase nickel incorporation protein HypA/HybF